MSGTDTATTIIISSVQSAASVTAFRDDLLEELEVYIERETGFQVTDHELKFYGMCRKCREEKENVK